MGFLTSDAKAGMERSRNADPFVIRFPVPGYGKTPQPEPIFGHEQTFF